MKDDVEIPDSANIKDCVEVKDLSGRYGEIYNFLRFLYDQEMLFLLELTAAQRKHFLLNFSRKDDNNPFTISTAVEKMIRFGKDRQLDTSKFEDLYGDMEHLRDNF
jgi:hypothetical protein